MGEAFPEHALSHSIKSCRHTTFKPVTVDLRRKFLQNTYIFSPIGPKVKASMYFFTQEKNCSLFSQALPADRSGRSQQLTAA